MPHNITKAVIDTCVLVDALMLNYVKTSSDKNLNEKWEHKVYDKNSNLIKHYSKFIDSIPIFVTTSQAMGEVPQVLKRVTELEGKKLTSFWQKSIEFLKTKRLDEKLISIIEMVEAQNNANRIFEIGIVDSGLIELAKREKLPIITNDANTLRVRAGEVYSLEIIIPSEYLMYWKH